MGSFGWKFDDVGWVVDPVTPIPREEAYSLFSADARAHFDADKLVTAARSLLDVTMEVTPHKCFPRGSLPAADIALVTVEGRSIGRATVEVRILPIERANDLRAMALGLGRAGMESLVSRARKVLQVRADDDGAALACAAIFASVYLAAILPPKEAALFGLKGARERLSAGSW